MNLLRKLFRSMTLVTSTGKTWLVQGSDKFWTKMKIEKQLDMLLKKFITVPGFFFLLPGIGQLLLLLHLLLVADLLLPG